MWWWRSIFFYMPPQTGWGEGLWPSLDREPQTGNKEELWWKCWLLDFLMKWIKWPTILRPSSPEQNDNQCQYVCTGMKHRIDDAAQLVGRPPSSRRNQSRVLLKEEGFIKYYWWIILRIYVMSLNRPFRNPEKVISYCRWIFFPLNKAFIKTSL